MIAGNKGEWSEIYAFLRLLSTGRLYAADSELHEIDGVFYEILKIFRKEAIGELKFIFCQDARTITVAKQSDDTVLMTLAASEFEEEAIFLLTQIQNGGDRAFSIARTKNFLNRIGCERLKAPADDKSDIKIQIHDVNTGFEPILGFSIKSRLGSPSTLLNPGRTTNFTYKISGLVDDAAMNRFNNYDGKIKDAFAALLSAGCRVDYVNVDNATFKNNLLLIDSDLPVISSLMLLEYYVFGTANIAMALREIERKNALNYDLSGSHPFYQYKFKKLITESALGMLPASPWTGRADATGGYIIVKEDGEVLCYHLYNRNEFEDYLLKNTKFDTPSRSRYGFAKIYKENGDYFIKLNMQIRFVR